MLGIGGEAQGIYEAIENEDYDLAITRSVQLAMTLTSALFFNCFTGETLVATEDGHKRIDEIEVGDLVWSANVETGEVELKEVTDVFVNETDTLVYVTVNGNVINTTEGHPFFVEGKGWIEAVELCVEDKLLLLNGGHAVVEDVKIECLDEAVKIYNFTVDKYHTYFVSKDEILVHNGCLSNREMNKIKSDILDNKDVTFNSLDDVLDFISKKFPDFPQETAGNRSAEGWHFDEHIIDNSKEMIKHINIYSKKLKFRVHLFWKGE